MKKQLLACLALAATHAQAQPADVACPSNGQSGQQRANDRDEYRDLARSESGYTQCGKP